MFTGLHPQLRPYAQYLYDEARRAGYGPTVTSVFRTRGQQARLYRRYLQGVSPWPAAPPGSSLHEFGAAFDMVVAAGGKSAQQRAVGELWERLGGRWGGRFNDEVHFEVAR